MEEIRRQEIINYTPHPATLLDEENNVLMELESQGSIRLESHTEKVWDINWIPVTKQVFGQTQLPEKVDWVVYLVSLPVAQYAKQQGRDDFVIPWEIVRSEDRSTILGMRSLAVL